MDAVERMQKAIEVAAKDVDTWRTIDVAEVDLVDVLRDNARMRAKIVELQATGTALVNERQDIRAALSDLYESCERTYMGGYRKDKEIEVFRHGMKTVCNVVDEVVARILGRGAK